MSKTSISYNKKVIDKIANAIDSYNNAVSEIKGEFDTKQDGNNNKYTDEIIEKIEAEKSQLILLQNRIKEVNTKINNALEAKEAESENTEE